MSEPISHSATRRDLLRGGIAAGALASVSRLAGAPTALARARGDAGVLHHLVAVELVVGFAYRHILAAGILDARARQMATVFAGHEQQHVAVLGADLQRRGRRLPAAPTTVAEADAALLGLHVTRSLTEVRRQREAIELLIGAEAAVTGAYYVGISKLADTGLLKEAAETMAAEAQHATALRRLLHPRSVDKYVPNPFVEGQH